MGAHAADFGEAARMQPLPRHRCQPAAFAIHSINRIDNAYLHDHRHPQTFPGFDCHRHAASIRDPDPCARYADFPADGCGVYAREPDLNAAGK